jgi:hypothetical protein
MWLTAISSINLTHSLMIYLHMNKGEVAPSQKKLLAGRVQFKKFCKLNSMSKRAFFEIHAFCLRYVFTEWCQMIETNGKENIPQLMGSFSTCMENTKKQVHALLEERIGDVQGLIFKLDARLQAQKNKKVEVKSK